MLRAHPHPFRGEFVKNLGRNALHQFHWQVQRPKKLNAFGDPVEIDGGKPIVFAGEQESTKDVTEAKRHRTDGQNAVPHCSFMRLWRPATARVSNLSQLTCPRESITGIRAATIQASGGIQQIASG